MPVFKTLKQLNEHVSFFHIEDDRFQSYGRIVHGYDFTELQSYMEKKTVIPQDGNIYVASVPEMEETLIKEQIQVNVYGDMPVQIGYCNGPNASLNGLEYHKGSEINIAVTDLVLLLGKVQDIQQNKFKAERVEAFFVPEGTAIELYSTTLHFAPCKVTDDGFKAVVILPAGTNEPLERTVNKRTDEDALLFMKNKWLLAHPDREVLINRGAYPGIEGDNIQIYYK